MDRLWRQTLDSLTPEMWAFAREQVNELDDVAFGALLEVGKRVEEEYGLGRQEGAYVALRAVTALWPEMFGQLDRAPVPDIPLPGAGGKKTHVSHLGAAAA